MAPNESRRMTFRRYGRSLQLELNDAADLARVLDVDESLWMANSAPVEAFVCDRAFLAFLDSDNNQRIRSDEVRRAIAWLLHMLSDTRNIGSYVECLPLDSINKEHAEGAALHAAAERILKNLGRAGAKAISVDQVRNTQRILADADTNGDGIIPPDATNDPDIELFLKDILSVLGGAKDASQKMGVTQPLLQQFLKESGDWLAWSSHGEDADGRQGLFPLGDSTADAYDALAGLRPKLNEFFTQCATVAFSPASARAFSSVSAQSDKLESSLAGLPVAEINPAGILNLTGPVNPLYKESLDQFIEKAVRPILGGSVRELTSAHWRTVQQAFRAYEAWQQAKPATSAGKLGAEKLRRYLAPHYRESVQALIDADLAAGELLRLDREVEKLILYQRLLLEFCNNYVSFPRFYQPDVNAMFEIGTLIMDGRHFGLNVRVENRAAHSQIAKNSRLYVVYCELSHTESAGKIEIATGITSGGVGNLYPGKHGIFIWRDGRVWDARVTQVIEHPISMTEAILMPFKRIGQLIHSQIERFVGSSEKLVEGQITTGMGAATEQAQAVATQPAPPRPRQPAAPRSARDFLMGGSVAVAVLGSSFAYITKTLSDLQSYTIILKILAVIIALVILPTVIAAWIKLRLRDVGTLLEAGGWAVNGRMRLTRRMQRVFTRRLRLPRGSEVNHLDVLREYADYARKPIAICRELIDNPSQK